MSKSQPTVSFYLSQVLDNIGEAIIVTNLTYNIIRFNKAAEKIYAWRSEDVMGRKISDCIPTQYINTTPEEVEEIIQNQGMWKGEIIQETQDGRSIIVASHVVCFTNSEGDAIGVVAINRDITEQKQAQLNLEHSEALWRAFANTLPDLALIFDKNGRYIQILNARNNLLSRPKDKLLNNYISNVFPNDIAKQFMRVIHKTIETGEVQIFEYSLPSDTGDIWLEARTTRFQIDPESEPMVIWVARDITERRVAEQQRLSLELLELKFESEQELSQFRSQLLTTISHEFRTPLSIIETSSYILQRYSDKIDMDKQEQHLNAVHSQVNHLKEMLDNITRTIETMNQEFQITSSIIELEAFCAELRNTLAENNNSNRIIFELRTAQKIYADKWILEIILSHLLNNALRYSAEDSTVLCSIEPNANYLTIQVSDTGIGIPEKEINHIFEPHFRGSNTGDIRGIGLGLSIVNNFVSQLQGKIYVNSRIDKGSTFIVQLPHLAFEENDRDGHSIGTPRPGISN